MSFDQNIGNSSANFNNSNLIANLTTNSNIQEKKQASKTQGTKLIVFKTLTHDAIVILNNN